MSEFPSTVGIHHILSTYSSPDEHLDCIYLWLLWIMLLQRWVYKHLFRASPAFNSFENILGCGTTGSHGNSIFNFLRHWQNCFPQWLLQHLTFLPVKYKSSSFSKPHNTCYFLCFFDSSILMGMEWYFIVILICISLMISNVEQLFMGLLAFFFFGLISCSSPLPNF